MFYKYLKHKLSRTKLFFLPVIPLYKHFSLKSILFQEWQYHFHSFSCCKLGIHSNYSHTILMVISQSKAMMPVNSVKIYLKSIHFPSYLSLHSSISNQFWLFPQLTFLINSINFHIVITVMFLKRKFDHFIFLP